MKTKPLGSIESVNGSLVLVLLDAALASAWEPLDEDSEDEDDIGGHPQKVIELLEDEDFTHASLKVGTSKALVLALEGAAGEAEMYRLADGTLAWVEPTRSWWDDEDNYGKRPDDVAALFEEALASSAGAKAAGKVKLGSSSLLVFDANADLTSVPKALAKPSVPVRAFGRDHAGVIVTLEPGAYAVRRRVLERNWAKHAALVVAYLVPA